MKMFKPSSNILYLMVILLLTTVVSGEHRSSLYNFLNKLGDYGEKCVSIKKDSGCKNGHKCARGVVDNKFLTAVWEGLNEICVDE